MKGNWIASGVLCGPTILRVTGIETNGAVRGTLECTKQGFVITLSDAAEYRKTMKARLSGKKLDLEGANSSGYELALEGDKLTGYALGGPGNRNPIIFTRQQ